MAATGGCQAVDCSRSAASTLPVVEGREGMEGVAGLEVLEGAPIEELLSDILGRLSIRLIGTIRSVFADV